MPLPCSLIVAKATTTLPAERLSGSERGSARLGQVKSGAKLTLKFQQNQSVKMQTEERKCVRYGGNGWKCPNIALSTSVYCHTHHNAMDVRNEKTRKHPKREFAYATHLPSGDLRCRRISGRRWQCSHKAGFGSLYCHKHGLEQQNRSKGKGPRRPNRPLMNLLSLNQEGNTRKRPNKQTPCITKKHTPGGGARKCRRWRCDEIASPGIYCQTHQLEMNSNACGGGTEAESSSCAVKPARGATKRKGAKKRWRDEGTTSADLVSDIDEHEAAADSSWKLVGSDTSLAGQQFSSPLPMQQRHQGFLDNRLKSGPTSIGYIKTPLSSSGQPGLASAHDLVASHKPIATPSVPVAPSQSTTSLPPTASSSPGFLRPSKSIASTGMPRQHSYNTRFGSALNTETVVAAAEQRDAPIEESGWVGTQRTASPDNQPTSDSNMEITSPEATMNLQENEGFSFDTDGAMNAVNFSFAQMEAEEDVMDVLAGVHSTVYVGDIPIPAEYEQIYKEIKDLHGPLENGESVCGERSLSHETLVELLKVAHELEGLTMESMTETTISNFKRIVAIGKLFHYNVGWLDEHLKHLSDVYAKCCAVDGELEQVERKITEKKHEEDMLKLEVDEIDENIRVLEESINEMKQKQESIEMEKKKKYSIVSSSQERILETSERICDTEVEFYRIATKPW